MMQSQGERRKYITEQAGAVASSCISLVEIIRTLAKGTQGSHTFLGLKIQTFSRLFARLNSLNSRPIGGSSFRFNARKIVTKMVISGFVFDIFAIFPTVFLTWLAFDVIPGLIPARERGFKIPHLFPISLLRGNPDH